MTHKSALKILNKFEINFSVKLNFLLKFLYIHLNYSKLMQNPAGCSRREGNKHHFTPIPSLQVYVMYIHPRTEYAVVLPYHTEISHMFILYNKSRNQKFVL